MRQEPRVLLESPIFFQSPNHGKPYKGIASELSLKGMFINTQRVPAKNAVLTIDVPVPDESHSQSVLAKVARTGEKGFAAEFIDITPAALEHIWSFLKPRISYDDHCPYCGKELHIDGRSDECPHCHYSLSFENPQYISNRDTWRKRKILASMIDTLQKVQLDRVYETLAEFTNVEHTKSREPSDEEMIGTCDKMNNVFQMIRRVAATDAPVLITGPSGTGKEMVATAIHERSANKEGAFVAINCGAIPENLLEAELFGYEKGAFTGAYKTVKGKIECASGGTLLLDEISEMPLSLQVKLLRFLEDHIIERLGGRRRIKVNLRVIAASNVNLKEAVKSGNFRGDLFYRLDIVRIELPPLTEREDDVIIMAKVFLDRYARSSNKKFHGFSNEAINAIKSHTWPGNVRELMNRIRRTVVMADDKWITPENLGFNPGQPAQYNSNLKEAREEFEADFIKRALNTRNNNVSQTAKDLEISRSDLYYLIKKHQIKRD